MYSHIKIYETKIEANRGTKALSCEDEDDKNYPLL